VESNQINILAFTVFRNLEQINYAKESRLARQRWSDIRKTDGLNRIHLDFTFFHSVPGACFDVRARPESDAAGDLSATNSFAKALFEHHRESLHLAQEGHFRQGCGCGVFGAVASVVPRWFMRKERRPLFADVP
jgi:hypothetical protein